MNSQKTITKQNLLDIIKEELATEADDPTRTQEEAPLQRQTAALLNDFRARIEKLERDNQEIVSILDRLIKRLMIKEGQEGIQILEAYGEEIFQEIKKFDESLILEVGEEFLTDEELKQLADIKKAREERGFMTPDERDTILQLQLAAAGRKKKGEEAELLLTRAKAAQMKKQLDPEALATTAEMPSLDRDKTKKVRRVDPLADTAPAPKLKRENKIITKSFLRQIIKEEIEVILSDEEAKEFFDIDVQEELDKKETE